MIELLKDIRMILTCHSIQLCTIAIFIIVAICKRKE